MNDGAKRFNEVASLLPENLRGALAALPDEVRGRVFEIRLRAGQPVMLTVPGDPLFVCESGGVSYLWRQGLLRCAGADIEYTFRSVCGYSVYSHQSEINAGFVVLEGGHRAGICGTAVLDNGKITNMKDIFSLNLRVAREIRGAAQPVLPVLREHRTGLVIAGAPGAGKTTVLRDLARLLGGGAGAPAKVVVIDERGELAAVHRGICRNDLGYSTDVISGCPKPQAIQMAVRTLSPDYILFDELGTSEELAMVEDGLNTGVRFVTTMHAADKADLLRRPLTRGICRCGAFSAVALLKNKDEPGRLGICLKTEDLYAEIRRADRADGRVDRAWAPLRVGEGEPGPRAGLPRAADR